ncbi:MAG: 3-hydroxyacyl-CoA dehydrogenase NAD-binding domain-containing protein [Casimicrobiaceae bacterium]|nr:3-hydroxyacyl-CoA dehydrogenase NAD-binding domain-containing protein [Casimicrobiaceae bacterium]
MSTESLTPFAHLKLRTDTDGILWVGIDVAGAAVNTLGAALRVELAQLLDRLAVSAPKGVVFYSEKASGFIAGADVHEFQSIARNNDAEAAKRLVVEGYELFERLATVPYPTLALIRGFCMGGGLELALACRYRVAVDEPATKLGLPEVMLGILPGWGGVKRLPQVVGAPAAFDLMLTGKTVDARRAKQLGLVDEAVPYRIMWNTARGVLLKAAPPRRLPFAQKLLTESPLRHFVARQAERQVAKRVRREHYPAPYAIIELWRRHDGDVRRPAPAEPCSLEQLLAHPTARQLIRVFGLREALKAQAKGIDFTAHHVHVVGAGVMGGDIAAWCALSGLRVTLEDLDAARIAPAFRRAHELFTKRLRDPRRVRDAMDRLAPDPRGHGATKADLIIEAVVEQLEVKRAVFARLEARARPEAVLATNTSSIPLEQIATALERPQRLVGIHFFNPVAQMMLVEVIRGAQTDAELVRRATAFVAQIDKLPLICKSAPGFWVNRILAPYLTEAMRCLDEGLAPETIDEAALAYGMPMGPVELADVVGLDVCAAVGQVVGGEAALRNAPRKLTEKIEAKQLGKKTGQGFYRWVDGKPQKAAAGAVPAGLSERLMTPLLDEAERALAEGVVANADLADAGAIFGCGFAPFRGGPINVRREGAR